MPDLLPRATETSAVAVSLEVRDTGGVAKANGRKSLACLCHVAEHVPRAISGAGLEALLPHRIDLARFGDDRTPSPRCAATARP